MTKELFAVKRIVVVGDAYVSADTLRAAAETLGFGQAEVIPLTWGDGDKNHFTDDVTLIERSGPEAVPCPEGLGQALEDADMLLVHFCPVPASVLRGARRLKLVGTCRGGVEHIAVEELNRRRISLVNIIRNARAVAEFTLGLMLAQTRNITRSHQLMQQGQWPAEFPSSGFVSTLENLTVGLVGLGNIGALVAEKLAALGVKVIGYDGYLSPEQLQRLPLEPADSMEDVFRRADVISIHLRLTEENHGIIDRKLMELMKPTAYLINVARGGLVVEADLCELLRCRRIAGAALDVFQQEPLPADSPFLELDNITLTPHIAGDTVDAIARSPYQLAQAIRGVLNGETGRVWNRAVLQDKRR